MTPGSGELLAHRPALRPGVLLSPAMLRGPATVHLVKGPDGGAFEVGPKEHFLISRLDGHRSLGEIGEEYAGTFGKRLAAPHWQRLLGLLGARRLLAGDPRPAPEEPPTPRTGPLSGTALRGSVRLVADADATTARLHRLLRPALRPAPLIPLTAGLLLMEGWLATRLPELARDTWWAFQQPVVLLAVCTLLWLSTALHELAHGVTARHHGGTVTEIGLRWRLPVAVMYCTVGNYPYLRGRWRQLAVAGAGAYANLLFLLPFLAWWAALPDGDPTRRALSALLLLGSAQALVNLVPLPPLDGYTMLGHALRVLHLGPESGRYLRLRFTDRAAAAAYPRRARAVYLGYALGSVLLVVVLLTALTVGLVLGLRT
ncbi:peptidase M50 [Streptomyces sp. AJS327]|uniref:M50 family metallopeptidase n=1 Tax=Streptomyces sp. AJS327 TaxID=2545265 RepID=UPI0015DD73C7|nr:M50 family metallopeptidase [Streptomyces sp. AJS327]MBA0052456.1 peptidase M50 [Streptomyces sp. AJS327]